MSEKNRRWTFTELEVYVKFIETRQLQTPSGIVTLHDVVRYSEKDQKTKTEEDAIRLWTEMETSGAEQMKIRKEEANSANRDLDLAAEWGRYYKGLPRNFTGADSSSKLSDLVWNLTMNGV